MADHCSRSRSCADGYTCIAHKVRHWRANGSPLSVPKAFKAANEGSYTQREIGNEIVAEAKAQGKEIHRQGARYF